MQNYATYHRNQLKHKSVVLSTAHHNGLRANGANAQRHVDKTARGSVKFIVKSSELMGKFFSLFSITQFRKKILPRTHSGLLKLRKMMFVLKIPVISQRQLHHAILVRFVRCGTLESGSHVINCAEKESKRDRLSAIVKRQMVKLPF